MKVSIIFIFLALSWCIRTYSADLQDCAILIKKLMEPPDRVLLPKLARGSFEIVRAKEAMPTIFPESHSPKWPTLMRMAHHYKLFFSHQGAAEELNFVIPALEGNASDLRALFKLEELLTELPTQILREVDYLVVNPTPYKREKEYIEKLKYLPHPSHKAEEHGLGATTGVNSLVKVHINLYYPRISENELAPLLSLFYHELGHILANKYYGRWTPDERWREARRADKFVVRYGANSLSEDFAETFRYYVISEGGLYLPRPREVFPRRFALLDEILEVDLAFLRENEAL